MPIRGRLLAIVVAGLAAMPAPPLFAHGSGYLFARVAISADGGVVLELTADVGDPLFGDGEPQARAVLGQALRLQRGGALRRLDEVGTLAFEPRAHHGADAPALPGDGDGDGPHRLLTAVWRAHLPGETLVFATPERTPHDVLLWQAQPSGPPLQWQLLISGERSRPIAVPGGAPPARAYWLGGALVALVSVFIAWQIARDWRARVRLSPAGAPRE